MSLPHDPTAPASPASPASSAAKGGDIPRTPTDSEIVDAAFEVAHFSKTHLWPKEGSPEFFEFATKLDRLSVAIQKRHPSFNRNIAAAMQKKAQS